MTTKVKTHKRKKKNGVSVVREYSRKDDKKTSKRGSGEEYTKKKGSSCSEKSKKSKKSCGKSCD